MPTGKKRTAKKDSEYQRDPLIGCRVPQKLKDDIEAVLAHGDHHSYADFSDFCRRALKRELNSHKGNVKRLKRQRKKTKVAA